MKYLYVLLIFAMILAFSGLLVYEGHWVVGTMFAAVTLFSVNIPK